MEQNKRTAVEDVRTRHNIDGCECGLDYEVCDGVACPDYEVCDTDFN